MGSLATPLLLIVFAAAAGATWIAGVALSKTTDALDVRLGFGEALGGIVLLAIAGSLPELAITISAASGGHLDLAAGVALEVTGNTLADRAGINGVIFGATVLAAATALPEISSGIAAVRLGDNALALGDIFGGNAFQVCLFLLADLIAGSPVLPSAGRLNSWVASLGVALTAIFATGIIVRPQRCFLRLGPDSWLAIVVFGLGIAGLIALAY